MLHTTVFSAAPLITVCGLAPALAPELEARVQAAWEQAVRASAGRLFNGRIAVVRSMTPQAIEVELTEYRRLVAARRDAAIAARLALRPLAVSGLLACADGVVVGRRGAVNTDAVGAWELAPSGGIDAAGLAPGDRVDPVRQLLTECEEELGLGAEHLAQATPWCMVADDDSGVVDLGIELQAPALRAAALHAAHAGCGSDEYTALRVMAPAELQAMAARGEPVLAVSLALLAARRPPRG